MYPSQPKSDLLDHPCVVQSNQTDQDNNPSFSEPKKPTLTVDDENIIVYQRRRGKQKEIKVQTQPMHLSPSLMKLIHKLKIVIFLTVHVLRVHKLMMICLLQFEKG